MAEHENSQKQFHGEEGEEGQREDRLKEIRHSQLIYYYMTCDFVCIFVILNTKFKTLDIFH